MKLKYSAGAFLLTCDLQDNELARRAGFAYVDRGTWATSFASNAARVAKIADPAVRAYIDKHLAREALNREKSKATDSEFTAPAPEGCAYKPYQRAGIEWIVSRPATLLGDEMGIGKTIQAIGACNVLKPSKVLIVCPASLKGNWAREWKKWTTLGLSVGVAIGSSWPDTDVVIINYDILQRHADKLHAVSWGAVILDEAQYLKNPKAIRTKQIFGGATRRALKADVKIALTGTPIPNKPIELYGLTRYLLPYGFTDRFKFAKSYCNATQTPWGWDMSGSSNLDELQERLRSTIMIRRLKADVLHDLPPKIRQIIELEPEDSKSKALVKRSQEHWDKALRIVGVKDPSRMTDVEYREMVKQLSGGGGIAFEEVSAMRKEAALAALPQVLEILKDDVEQVGKVVCFAWHKDVIAEIEKAFPGEHVTVDGDTPKTRVQSIVDKFQTDKQIKIFIGNLVAAGTGLTLTASSHVVMVEGDWVPGNVSQAEDRCHRYGQKDSVLVKHLVLAGSIQAYMAKMVVSKQETIEQALDYRIDPAIAELLK